MNKSVESHVSFYNRGYKKLTKKQFHAQHSLDLSTEEEILTKINIQPDEAKTVSPIKAPAKCR